MVTRRLPSSRVFVTLATDRHPTPGREASTGPPRRGGLIPYLHPAGRDPTEEPTLHPHPDPSSGTFVPC